MAALAELSSSYHLELEKAPDKCGVLAIRGKGNITPYIPRYLANLDHRGPDVSGFSTFRNGELMTVHVPGLARNAYENFDFTPYASQVAIGHTRYATSGGENKNALQGAQPFQDKYGIYEAAIALNGNENDELRRRLRDKIPRDMSPKGDFDTVDLLQAIVGVDIGDNNGGDPWILKLRKALNNIPMAYAITLLTNTGRVFGLRGPSRHWPLWIGEAEDRIVIASETYVDKSPDIHWNEVKPGELVEATSDGVRRTQLFPALDRGYRCPPHDFYMAKAESLVHEDKDYRYLRYVVGSILAEEDPYEADVYAAVPNSGLEVAEGYAQKRNIMLTDVLHLNGYGRSFLANTIDGTHAILKGKFGDVNPKMVEGKRVKLIDETTIKGTTLGGYKVRYFDGVGFAAVINEDETDWIKGVNDKVREAGATEISNAIALPPFYFDCHYGMYIRQNSLVTCLEKGDGTYEFLSTEQVAKRIGADKLYHTSTEGVKRGYGIVFGPGEHVCMACMGEPDPLELVKQGSLRKGSEIMLFDRGESAFARRSLKVASSGI